MSNEDTVPGGEDTAAPEDDQPELDFEAAGGEDTIAADAGAPDQTAAELAEARRKLDEANARAEAAERRAREQVPPAPKNEEDRLRAEEDRRLSDAKTTDLEKWQIQSNRTIRESRAFAGGALAQAADLNDRTSFSQYALSKPQLYNRYKDRVEAEVQRIRQAGHPVPPRENILKYLIGNDAVDGKLTRKKAAAPADGQQPQNQARGGKTPGARSDVGGGKGLSEREKRRQRLENQPI